MIAPTPQEANILRCRWFRLLAHAVDEAGRAVTSLVTEVRVVDTPVPLGEVVEKVTTAALVWLPLVVTVTPICPVSCEVPWCNSTFPTAR